MTIRFILLAVVAASALVVRAGEPPARCVRLVDARTGEALSGLEVTIVSGDEPRDPYFPPARRLFPWLEPLFGFIDACRSPRVARIATAADDGVARFDAGEIIYDVRVAGGDFAFVGDPVPVSQDSVPTVRLARAGAVSGRVTDEMGFAIAGAEIAAISVTYEPDRPPWVGVKAQEAKGVTRTDDGGRFTLPPLPSRSLVKVVARKIGFAPGLSEPLAVRDGRETALAAPIRLREDAPLAVRVIGPDGAPVPFAQVLWGEPEGNFQVFCFYAQTAVADRGGRATIRRGVSRERLLVVSAPGHPTEKIGPMSESEFPIDVVLEEPASIGGRLVNARGEPLALQTVSVWREGESEWFFSSVWSMTDAAGRFEFVGLAPGAYLIGADRGGAPIRARVTVPPDAADVELVAPCGEIRGVAIDAETGEPIVIEERETSFTPVATVIVDSEAGFSRHGEFLDASPGEFVVSGLDEGSHRVNVWVDGYRLASSEPVRVGSAETVTGVRVPLEKAAMIRGVVVDAATGSPVAGASLSGHCGRWRDPESDCGIFTPGDFVTACLGNTDEAGRFSMAAQATGLFSLGLFHEAYGGASIDVLVVSGADPGELRWELEPRLSLSGTVRRGGVPVSRASVLATVADDEGRYRLAVERPGPILVSFRDGNGPTQYAEFVVPSEGLVADLSFAPDDAGIAGTARFADGPAAHAAIEVLRLAGPGLAASRRSLVLSGADARADENGEFEIGGLSPGEYEVTIRDFGDWRRTIHGLVRVPESGFARCDLVASDVRLVVRPVDSSGDPVLETVSVSLESLDETLPRGRHYQERIIGEGAGGSVEIDGLLPGRYRVRARTKLGLAGWGDATVPGEPLVVALEECAHVTVWLRSEGRPPAAAHAVFLPRTEGPPVEIRDGGDLAPGSYDVVVAARGFPPVRHGTVELGPGETLRVVANAPVEAGRLTLEPEALLPPGTRLSILDAAGTDLAWLAGEFPTFTLAPGDYEIRVTLRDGREQSVLSNVAAGGRTAVRVDPR